MDFEAFEAAHAGEFTGPEFSTAAMGPADEKSGQLSIDEAAVLAGLMLKVAPADLKGVVVIGFTEAGLRMCGNVGPELLAQTLIEILTSML
jgi:hypothetical protein